MHMDVKRYATHATVAEATAAMLAELLPIVANIDVIRNRVLLATFQRPEKTAGGILLVDSTLNEEKWQGKTGLVLKVGPVAFHFDEVLEDIRHGDADAAFAIHNIPRVGDWVFFRNSDAWDCGIQVAPGVGVHCRFIDDGCIQGRVTDPTLIW